MRFAPSPSPASTQASTPRGVPGTARTHPDRGAADRTDRATPGKRPAAGARESRRNADPRTPSRALDLAVEPRADGGAYPVGDCGHLALHLPELALEHDDQPHRRRGDHARGPTLGLEQPD